MSLGIPGAGHVSLGSHVCALHSGPAERDRLLFPFVDEGVRHGDRVLVLVDDMEPAVVRDRAVGRPGGESRPTAHLDVERAADVHLRAGRAAVDGTARLLIDRVDAAVAADFELLRVVGETSWILTGPTGDDLRLRESALDRVVAHLPTIVLCLFDLTKFGADALVDVLRTHATVLLDGAMIDNPYYVQPPLRPSARRVDVTDPRRVDAVDEATGDGWGSLTLAELRVASHVSHGTTNRIIAAHLQVSRHTVDAHLKHIFLKLDIHSRVELTVLVLQHRLALDETESGRAGTPVHGMQAGRPADDDGT